MAYAYLQGETSNSGRLDDTSNMVTQVGRACGGSRESGLLVWGVLLTGLPARGVQPVSSLLPMLYDPDLVPEAGADALATWRPPVAP